MARREESVDTELLAQMESGGDRIRVPLPNRKVNEMFAIADQILGGRRVRSVCEDGETRLARIPGKMRRRQWVREGDLIVVQPWEFQEEKANVCMRYTKTQSLYLESVTAMDEQAEPEEPVEQTEEELATEDEAEAEAQEETQAADDDEDDIDSFFG